MARATPKPTARSTARDEVTPPEYTEIETFSRDAMGDHALRPYQLEPARAIVESIEQGLGRQFAVVFSRQAGKDELLAQVLAYLLWTYRERGGSAVLAAPTFRPQAALSRDRLLDRLASPTIADAARVKIRDGYAVHLGRASARFLSGSPYANARGQTADLLLVANEAQDIRPEVWDAVFDPMAASTNATTLFLGTVWSNATLLARQMRHLEELQERDGIRRVWRVPWEQVAEILPAYGERVRARIAQFGIDHPFIRTEYCLLELDGDNGLFPPVRLSQMEGSHPRRHRAQPGKRYALLIDVAGEEEGGADPAAFASGSRRDSTALTVVEIDEAASADEEPALPPLPSYRVVDRMAWVGKKHTALHAQIIDLARNVWRASAVVVDSTGVGHGLSSFLERMLGDRRGGYPTIQVVPYVFSLKTKSELGWNFLALIDSGRFKEYAGDGDALTRLYWSQLRETTYEVLPGPNKRMRWSVPASRGHDDLVISAALTAALDDIDWRPRRAIGHTRTED
ncbi:MAG: hypothetical protein ACRDJH_23600 [Thermomicrobiales bacterium]